MPVETADWIVAFFFFMALVLVSRFRTQMKAVSARSYDSIAGGLIILALAALAWLYHALGLFERVPFLSESVFFDLAYWIAVITGATFMISGVADWLPLARHHRQYHRERIEHLDLLRKVEQLVGVDTRLESILATALQYMTEQMSFTAGTVLKCSFARRTLTVAATTGDFPMGPQSLKQVELNPSALWSGQREAGPDPGTMLSNLPPELGRAQAVLPIIVQRQPVGFFLFWGDQAEPVNPDGLLTLRLAVDVIARKIDMDRLTLHHGADNRYQRRRENLESLIGRSHDTRQRFVALTRSLSEWVDFDNATLLIIDRTGKKARRYSSGTSGRVLVEAGLSWPPEGSLVASVIETGQSVTYSDLDETQQPQNGEMVTSRSAKSLLIIPSSDGDRLSSVLMLASRQRAAFSSRVQRQVKALGSLINLVAMPDVMKGIRNEEKNRLERLRRFWVEANAEESPDNMVLANGATLISDETNAGLVRVSLIDETGSFLESRALVASRPVSGLIPANGQLILSLMPTHLQVMNTGHAVALDETTIETVMSGIERRQAFAENVRSALLVPLMNRRRVVGIVSIAALAGEPPLTLNQTTQSFVRAVADQLATTLDRPVPQQPQTDRAVSTTIDRLTKSQVRSSLTGILGSVELLRSRPAAAYDEGFDRYLSIIDRSARKIDEAVESS